MNRRRPSFMVFEDRFTTQVLTGLMQHLVSHAERKGFLIMDDHPVHRFKKTKAWLAKNTERSEVLFLPRSCPELNPDELLNHAVKANAVGRRCARSRPELMKKIRGILRRRKRQRTLSQVFR